MILFVENILLNCIFTTFTYFCVCAIVRDNYCEIKCYIVKFDYFDNKFKKPF